MQDIQLWLAMSCTTSISFHQVDSDYSNPADNKALWTPAQSILSVLGALSTSHPSSKNLRHWNQRDSIPRTGSFCLIDAILFLMFIRSVTDWRNKNSAANLSALPRRELVQRIHPKLLVAVFEFIIFSIGTSSRGASGVWWLAVTNDMESLSTMLMQNLSATRYHLRWCGLTVGLCWEIEGLRGWRCFFYASCVR